VVGGAGDEPFGVDPHGRPVLAGQDLEVAVDDHVGCCALASHNVQVEWIVMAAPDFWALRLQAVCDSASDFILLSVAASCIAARS